MKTHKTIKTTIEIQGRKKNWLAYQLNISRPTLDRRLVNEKSWKPDEITKLKQLGLLI